MRDDPCLTDLAGTTSYAVTGAFTDTSTLLTYPVAIERGSGGFRITPLQLAEPRHGHRPVVGKLVSGLSSVTVPPTMAFAIVQPFANQLPVYLAGARRSGTFDAPRTLTVAGFSPTMRAGTVFFDRRCKPPGASDIIPVSVTNASGNLAQDLGRQLSEYWTRLTRSEGESCP